ncbi:hypothetical protein CU097_003269, partial [Rhizopus azygosporus]
PDDLILFKLPCFHKPGEDRVSKLIARHQSTVDMIAASLLGVNEGTYASTNTTFTDSAECDVLYIPQSSATQSLPPVIIEFQHSVTKRFMCRSIQYCINNVILELAKRRDPAQLSDIRLLVLNNIYKFDRDFASSVSKYFSSKVHTLLKPILSFDVYLPAKGLNCYDWCMKIEVSPPVDWISSITLCIELLTKACESKNLLDIHTVHVLAQILP